MKYPKLKGTNQLKGTGTCSSAYVAHYCDGIERQKFRGGFRRNRGAIYKNNSMQAVRCGGIPALIRNQLASGGEEMPRSLAVCLVCHLQHLQDVQSTTIPPHQVHPPRGYNADWPPRESGLARYSSSRSCSTNLWPNWFGLSWLLLLINVATEQHRNLKALNSVRFK